MQKQVNFCNTKSPHRLGKKSFFRNILLVAFLTAFESQVVSAAKGVVVHKNYGCSYYIVESPMGYAVLEWYGGNDPSIGDI